MKIAILLSGHAMEYQSCFPSLKTNILDHFNSDIYIHSYKSDCSNEVIDLYNPKKIVLEDENDCIKICTFPYKTFSYIPNPMNQYHMWRKRKLCFDLIEEEYDLLIQTRFDCKYLSSLKIEEINPNQYNIPSGGNYEGGIFDMFCISSQKNMKYYFSLFDFLEEYTKEELFHSERLLKKHLLLSNTEINRFDYPIILRKFNSQENCVMDRIFTV